MQRVEQGARGDRTALTTPYATLSPACLNQYPNISQAPTRAAASTASTGIRAEATPAPRKAKALNKEK
jgi:hypothetical protein